MKKALLLLFFVSYIAFAFAQDSFEHLKRIPGCFLPAEADSGFWWSDRGGLHDPENEYTPEQPAPRLPGLPIVHLSANMTLHFLSPQPIQYTDISVKVIEGDLPMNNLLRIKLKDGQSFSGAVVTIVGEDFIAQYQVVPGSNPESAMIEIQPGDTKPLNTGISLSRPALEKICAALLLKHAEANLEHAEAYGVRARLNHLYTLDDYIFLDMGYDNRTRLHYNIDEFRFKIDDKKITKATTVQSLEIKPEFILLDQPGFSRHYRNVFVFKKFTIPGNKILHIELNEKQLSGRVISLNIPYKDILNADVIPND